MAKGRRNNGEGSLLQRADGTWRGRITIGKNEEGKLLFKDFYGKTKKETLQKINKYTDEHLPALENGTIPTVGEFTIRWLLSVKKIALKPSSYDRLESTAKTHIVNRIGHIKLTELTTEDVQLDVINAMQAEHHSYSSIKKAHDCINAVCEYAYNQGKIQRNPVALTNLPPKAETKQREVESFTAEEREKIIALSKDEYATGRRRWRYAPAFVFQMYSGLRMSEVLALKWSQVDLVNRRVTVTNSVVMVKDRSREKSDGTAPRIALDQDTTKTASKRTVPLCKRAVDSLVDLKEHGLYDPTGYVVCTQVGKPLKPDHYDKTFAKLLDRAAVKHAGSHALRHTCATMLFEAGTDIRVISAILGHSSTAITYDIYIHVIERLKTAAVDKIADIV